MATLHTELIPVPDSPSASSHIFHAFFSPQEETPEPEVEAYHTPLATPEQS